MNDAAGKRRPEEKFPSPLQVLKEATKAVPIVKYALGVVGVAAAVTIIGSFKLGWSVALFATMIMLMLMAVLIVLAGAPKVDTRRQLQTFIWFSIIVVMGMIVALLSSVLFNSPLPLQGLLKLPGQNNPLPSDPQVFQRLLEARDPAIFNGLHPESYRLARVYPKREDLDNGGFSEILKKTAGTLDIAVIGGRTVVGTGYPAIEQAINNGVKVRIVMFDVDPLNRANCDALARGTGRDGCADLQKDHAEVESILKGMHDRTQTAKGSLQVHAYSDILPYTMWIRDAAQEKFRLALIRVHMSSDRANWPSFVVGNDAPELIQNLQTEFKKIWESDRCRIIY